MSGIGRNNPCSCGSGKKYKYCCMNKNSVDDIFLMDSIYSNGYPRKGLDKFNKFFIDTTKNEKFEISKLENNLYLIRDLVPPIISIGAKNYISISPETFKENQTKYEFEKFPHSMDIIYGSNFAWEKEDGVIMASKGLINKLYINHCVDNFNLNINLFSNEYEKEIINVTWEKGFTIKTNFNEYNFINKDSKLYFEDEPIFAIFSVTDKNSLTNEEMFPKALTEYNLSLEILKDKPFFILKFVDNNLKISIINEQIISVN